MYRFILFSFLAQKLMLLIGWLRIYVRIDIEVLHNNGSSWILAVSSFVTKIFTHIIYNIWWHWNYFCSYLFSYFVFPRKYLCLKEYFQAKSLSCLITFQHKTLIIASFKGQIDSKDVCIKFFLNCRLVSSFIYFIFYLVMNIIS